MSLASPTSSAPLQRRIGLRSAVAFNMLEMIGVGPFITIPLLLSAMNEAHGNWKRCLPQWVEHYRAADPRRDGTVLQVNPVGVRPRNIPGPPS